MYSKRERKNDSPHKNTVQIQSCAALMRVARPKTAPHYMRAPQSSFPAQIAIIHPISTKEDFP
jgi:hypothetical protein